MIVKNIYKTHHNHTFCFFDTTVWIYFCFLGVDCGNCPNNQRLIVQLLEEWFLFKMSSFTLMMLFSNLENGRAEEEDEQVAAQCLGRKILTKEKATQNSIGKSWNKSYWWQVQGVFSGLQNLCLYQRLGETTLVKTSTNRKDFLRPIKKQHGTLGPRKIIWPKFPGGPSSWVPKFTVAQVEHRLTWRCNSTQLGVNLHQ